MMLASYLKILMPKILKPALSSALNWSSLLGSLFISIILVVYKMEAHIADTPAAYALYTFYVIDITFLIFIVVRLVSAPYEIYKDLVVKIDDLARANNSIMDSVSHTVLIQPLTQWRDNQGERFADIDLMLENVGDKALKVGKWSYRVQGSGIVTPPIILASNVKDTIIARSSSISLKFSVKIPDRCNGIFLSTDFLFGIANGEFVRKITRVFELTYGSDILHSRVVFGEEGSV